METFFYCYSALIVVGAWASRRDLCHCCTGRMRKINQTIFLIPLIPVSTNRLRQHKHARNTQYLYKCRNVWLEIWKFRPLTNMKKLKFAIAIFFTLFVSLYRAPSSCVPLASTANIAYANTRLFFNSSNKKKYVLCVNVLKTTSKARKLIKNFSSIYSVTLSVSNKLNIQLRRLSNCTSIQSSNGKNW